VKVARSIAEYCAHYTALAPELRSDIVYVPTMGALHDGHRSLIRLAHSLGRTVAVSIFVNPLQFGPDEDYARYPRPLESDLMGCAELGVDLVLAPSVADLYPAGRQVTVSAGALGSILEGSARPGHFDGVLTVVLKLLNIVRPRVAIFGQKDAQQLACIQRMVLDLNIGVEILGGPIVREPDGLALSSRNIFLTSSERVVARNLCAAAQLAAAQGSVADARIGAYEILKRAAEEPEFVLDYATVVNPVTFAELADDDPGPALFVVAAMVGSTRLLDNARIEALTGPVPDADETTDEP
jgi:pantoate--beta-alanine ligase